MNQRQCPCSAAKAYDDCCGRFLDQGKQARTPEQLMRSRYSAYALGGYGEYLLATWFPATASGLSALDLSQRHCDWQRLEIVAKSQQGDSGSVTFNAWYTDKQGQQCCMHEESQFKRSQGRWLYVGGVVS